MSLSENRNERSAADRRKRTRLRGYLSGRSGKALGVATIVTPLLGWAVRDLQRPDSALRRIARVGLDRFLEYRRNRARLVDVSDKVEVVTDGD
jgi:hypothetical protein